MSGAPKLPMKGLITMLTKLLATETTALTTLLTALTTPLTTPVTALPMLLAASLTLLIV